MSLDRIALSAVSRLIDFIGEEQWLLFLEKSDILFEYPYYRETRKEGVLYLDDLIYHYELARSKGHLRVLKFFWSDERFVEFFRILPESMYGRDFEKLAFPSATYWNKSIEDEFLWPSAFVGDEFLEIKKLLPKYGTTILHNLEVMNFMIKRYPGDKRDFLSLDHTRSINVMKFLPNFCYIELVRYYPASVLFELLLNAGESDEDHAEKLFENLKKLIGRDHDQISEILPLHPQSLEELDRIVDERINVVIYDQVDLNQVLFFLDGECVEGYRLSVPKTSNELFSLSDKLIVPLHSHVDSILKSESNLIALTKGEQAVCCVCVMFLAEDIELEFYENELKGIQLSESMQMKIELEIRRRLKSLRAQLS